MGYLSRAALSLTSFFFALTTLGPLGAFEAADVARLETTRSCRGCDLTGAQLAGTRLGEADLDVHPGPAQVAHIETRPPLSQGGQQRLVEQSLQRCRAVSDGGSRQVVTGSVVDRVVVSLVPQEEVDELTTLRPAGKGEVEDPVESPRPQQCRVEGVRPVGGPDEQDVGEGRGLQSQVSARRKELPIQGASYGFLK